MTDPIVFQSQTPRLGLPLLFAGQSQKELFVNEALSRADALLHCAILGEATDPPLAPVDGDNWIIGASATGDWAGEDGNIACRQAGNWLFVTPADGMRVLDTSTGQQSLFLGAWQKAVAPVEPSGGSSVDTEARTAITQLIAALRVSGILPTV